MKNIVMIFVLIIFNGISHAQGTGFEFLPDSTNFIPLKANHQEAKLGVLYLPENGHLKVDVGNSVDLFKYSFSTASKLTMGIEFMAYAYSTNYKEQRLQIDALDGFFGGNLSFSSRYQSSRLLGRFRIIHNSAHLVDGHYDIQEDRWKNGDTPIAFTQDFGELLVAHELIDLWGRFKYYVSITYATLVRPANLEKWSGSLGFELNFDNIFGKTFGKETNLFFANHTRYAGLPEYNISLNNIAGVKFGDWLSKGIVVYISYYYGNNVFNEYFIERVSQFGIGFFIEFF
jgi:hypothetical protein